MAVDYKFMASFNKDVIETDVFSEADSVTYKLELSGATNYSAAPYVKINDVSIGTTFVNGLNLRGFTTADGKNPVVKSYELTDADSSINTGFITYMGSVAQEITLIISGKGLKSSPSIDTWFKSKGSINWPGSYMANNYSCGYVGIYSKSKGKIVAEVMCSTDGTDSGSAQYLTVYDTLADIGSLGFPDRLVNDTTEYSTTTAYEYKRLPTTDPISKMADYGLSSNSVLYISSDMYQDQALLDANMKTRINLRWYQGTTLKESVVLENAKAGYTQNSIYSEAPAGADGFTIVVYRYPRNDAITGMSAIKNLVVTQVSRDGSKSGSNAAIGVNGIKTGNYTEGGTSSPNIMDLRLDINALMNNVNIVSMREGDTGKPPDDWQNVN